MAARLVGAEPIIGVDIRPKRLKLGLELGLTHVIDNRRQDVAARIAEITGSGVDYVVETTTNPKMHQLAIEVLNPNGVVALLTGEKGKSFPGGRKTLGIIQGDAVPQQFIPKLIKLYQAGKFPFDRLVKFYKFSEINRAIADSKSGETIKPVLRIGKV
jgi:aryl-alcohol dehydrogenase